VRVCRERAAQDPGHPLIAERYGWTASFLVAAALCVVGALAWLVVDPKQRLAT